MITDRKGIETPWRETCGFRRHWGFTPALWNLYFRERINLGGSLRVKSRADVQSTADTADTDAALAAADLLKNLIPDITPTGASEGKSMGISVS